MISSSMEMGKVSAVILDMDGTLLDTERATRGILGELLARYGKVVDAEKEEKRLGQMHEESTMGIVKDYELPLSPHEFSDIIMPMHQEKWKTTKPLPGANRLMRHLHKNKISMGLASNSKRTNLEFKVSNQKGWNEYFSVILGGSDVKNGKPAPDIFLEAARRLGVDTSSCLVIEDSPVGVKAAKESGAKVVAVPSLQGQTERYSIANLILNSLLDFKPESWGLPPFDDWIENALPIEPLYSGGLVGVFTSNNALSITQEDCSYDSIPDQVCGVFFGWAKLENNKLYKIVVCTGWDLSLHTPKRIMEAYLIDYYQNISKEKLQLLLVGYIRPLQIEEKLLDALKITEKDEYIARASLDLPIFSKNKNFQLFG